MIKGIHSPISSQGTGKSEVLNELNRAPRTCWDRIPRFHGTVSKRVIRPIAQTRYPTLSVESEPSALPSSSLESFRDVKSESLVIILSGAFNLWPISKWIDLINVRSVPTFLNSIIQHYVIWYTRSAIQCVNPLWIILIKYKNTYSIRFKCNRNSY